MKEDQPTVLQTRTVSAQFYFTGAYLQRECIVEVAAGISEFLFDGLSYDTDDDRIYVEAQNGVSLLSLTVEESDSGDDKYCEAVKGLTKAKRELRLLESEAQLLEGEIALLNDNRRLDCGGDKNKIEQFSAYYLQRLKTMILKRAAMEEGTEESREEVRKWQERVNAARQRRAKRVRVNVSAREDTTASFKLRYFVTGASWQPRYDIHSNGEGSRLTATLKAGINNNSGENISDAGLTFSTGAPMREQYVPEFVPQYVPEQKPRPLVRAMALSSAPVFEDGNGFVAAQITDTQTERIFTAAGLYSVPDGVKDMSIELERTESEAKYGYECVTCAAQTAFFTARSDIRLSVPNAQTNMFLRGRLCGGGRTDEFADSEKKFCFGADSGIAVSRRRLADYTAKKLGGAEKTDKSYVITLKNNKSMPVTIEVTDRIPVSVNKAVTVESLLSEGGVLDKTNGKATWIITLQPDESKELKAQYSITAAKA